MAKDYFYHLTKREKLKDILSKGLVPCVGENSRAVSEEESFIYLCKKKDIPFWKILVDSDVLLRVDMDGISDFNEKESKYPYILYDEYLYNKVITPDRIKECSMECKTENAMKALCLNFLYSISYISTTCARYYGDIQEYDEESRQRLFESLKWQLDNFSVISKRLDYSILSKDIIKKKIKEMGEACMFVFTDTYNQTDKRLYEQMILFPEDELMGKRREVYDFLIENLDGCLTVNTGGFS